MNTICNGIANWCKKNGALSEEDYPIILYGIEILLNSPLKMSGILLISLILHHFWTVLISMAVFCSMRYWTGGWHSKTHSGCFCAMLIPCLVPSLLKGLNGEWAAWVLSGMMLCAIYRVFRYAPCNSKVNPIKDIKCLKRKRIGSIVEITGFWFRLVQDREKGGIMKRILLGLCVSMMLWGITACGRNEDSAAYTLNDVPLNKTESTSIVEDHPGEGRVWKDSHTSLGCRFEGAVIKGDVAYGYAAGGSGVKVTAKDTETGSILLETEITGATEAHSIAAGPDGSVYLLGMQGEKDAFWRISRDGQISVMEDFVLADTENALELKAMGMIAGEDGYFYLWYRMALPVGEIDENDRDKDKKNVYGDADRIYVLDSQQHTVFYEQVPGFGGHRLLGFSVSENGGPVILAQSPEGVYLQEIRAQKEDTPVRKWMNEAGMGEADAEEGIFAAEDGVLFYRGSSLYKYTFEDGTDAKILDLSIYGISPASVICIGMNGGKVEIIDNYDEESEYTCLQEGESSRKQLTLGVMQVSQELEKTVTQFNRYHEDIRIEPVAYYKEGEEFERGLEKLKLDIVKGEAPDILEVSLLDCEMFAEKGILADLYEYMARDSDYRKEMLMPGVLEAYELEGHLYSMSPGFQLYSMWGDNAVIRDRYGVTQQELIEILKGSHKGLDCIYGFSADEPVLTTLCTMGMDVFVDWETGTCDFEGESFREVLEFAKAYRASSYTGSLSSGIKEGRFVMSVGMISSVADYQLQSALYGGNISFIGYPSVNGSGTALGLRGSQLAINASGKDREAAWQFLKYYLLNGYDGGFPVMKEQFEEVMAQSMEKKYATYEGGSYEVSRQSYMDQDAQIEVYEATQEDVAAVRQLVERAEIKFEYHTEIQNIINEEA